MCEGRRVRPCGENATLQIVDRLDHQSSWEHKAAVVRCLVKPSRGSENVAVTAAENPRLPTVAQLMLSQELAMQSYNSQAAARRSGKKLARPELQHLQLSGKDLRRLRLQATSLRRTSSGAKKNFDQNASHSKRSWCKKLRGQSRQRAAKSGGAMRLTTPQIVLSAHPAWQEYQCHRRI